MLLEDVPQWTFSLLLLGGLLFVGLFNIIVYLVSRRLRVHFYFGMICLFYVLWYSSKFMTIDVFPLDALSQHHRIIIGAISTTQMALFLSLYTLHTLKLHMPSFEKGLKYGYQSLLVACFLMPFSISYTESLILIIEFCNAVVQIYLSYKIIKIIQLFYKDIRIIPAICYLFICMATVMQFIGMEARSNTIFLAFFMMGIQGVILSLHYNRLLVEAEQTNVELERKVADRTADLVQKEKETIHLISSICHDLRTPIAVVGGYLELLKIDTKSMGEESGKYLDNSLVRLSQMDKLTRDLFTLSQVSNKDYTFTLGEIHVAEIIEGAAFSYIDQAKQKGITLIVNVEAATCIADRMRVLQVLDNLLINALAYASTSITISNSVKDEEVQITVSDDGEGIHQDDLPFVFDRFYRKSQQGSGLGLSNVRELIHRMNGVVIVESELHIGTNFHFTLPLVREKTPDFY